MSKEHGETTPAPSSIINLEVIWAPPRIWLGPAWAVVCGSLASPDWKFSGATLLTMLLSLFLVDGILGSVWRQVSILASEREEVREEKRVKRRRLALPPYLQPSSSGYRLWRWFGTKWWAWWGTGNPTPRTRVGILITSLLALVLGVFLAPAVLILVAISLLVAWGWFSRIEKDGWLSATYSGGLPWLLGYMSIANMSGNLLDIGQLATLAKPIFWAAVYLAVVFAFQRIDPENPRNGLPILILAQLAGTLALILAKQPILAAIAGLLLLPQVLFMGKLPRQKQGRWYLERIQVFTMGSMLLGAIALHLG